MPNPPAASGAMQADDTHLGELGPQPGDATGVVLPRGAHGLGLALVGEEIADGVTEQHLVFGEGELHQSPTAGGRARARR